MKYRTRIDIIAEILKAAEHGAPITRMLRKARISSDQLFQDSYLPLLVSKGLLQYDKKGRIYKTTPSGRRLLSKYGDIKL